MTVLEQQRAILDAAHELLAAGGPQALRVRDIAEAANCTTMTVYSRFGGKDGVVEAMYIDGFERFTQALQDELTTGRHDQALRMGLAYRDWALANPGSYQIMFTEAVPGFVPSEEATLVAQASFGVLLGSVENAQANGQIRPGDPTEIAWALWGIAHGLVMLEIAGMQPNNSVSDPAAVYVDALDATFRGFAPVG